MKKILCFVHSEALFPSRSSAEQLMDSLSLYFSCVLSLNPYPSLPLNDVYNLEVIQKRKSGKVAKFDEVLRFEDGAFKVHFFNPDPTAPLSGSHPIPSVAIPSKNPGAGLTFNLELTEEQKRAKDATVLPYMHQLNSSNSATQSFIYLEDADSDEDPDDDLDI